jgi:plastocyanin
MRRARVRTVAALSLTGVVFLMGVAAAQAAVTHATVGVSNTALTPKAVTVAPGGTVTWSMKQGSHAVADATPLKLFSSGTKAAGSSFSAHFIDAGTYPYTATGGTKLAGTVVVPVLVTPASANRTTYFTVRWGSDYAPTGDSELVEIKTPGGSWTSFAYLTVVKDATFRGADWSNKTGTYSFRAKLVKGTNLKASSQWSPIASVTVK